MAARWEELVEQLPLAEKALINTTLRFVAEAASRSDLVDAVAHYLDVVEAMRTQGSPVAHVKEGDDPIDLGEAGGCD